MSRLPSTLIAGEYHLHGRRFKSLAALEAYERQWIAKAEQAAGRTLTAKELLFGIEHVEDRDPVTIRRDKARRVEVHTEPQPDTRHPFDRADAMLRDHRDSREALSQRMRDAYDQRVAREQPDTDADRKQQAKAHAYDLWSSVAFSPTAPKSHVVDAEFALSLAERGALQEYVAFSTDLVKRIAEHRKATVAKIDIARAQQLADLPSEFEAVKELPEQPQPQLPYSWQEIQEASRDNPHRAWLMQQENDRVADAT